MVFLFLEKLSQDFTELLNDKQEYNVRIEVDQNKNKKTFTAHSVVLRYRSSYFNKELTNTVPGDNNNYNIKTITKQNISAQIFEIILKKKKKPKKTKKTAVHWMFQKTNLVVHKNSDDGVVLHKLSQDFTELLNDKQEYNVRIEVDQNKNKKTFTAHSVVLRYRSSYFNKELTNTVPGDNNNYNIKTITKQNISAQIFEIILKYIYGGIIDTENMDTKTSFELMIAANMLEFEELSEKLENHLIESKASWMKTHFFFVYRSIFKHNKFQNLENFCNDIIAKHPNLIFESTEFTSLPESALVSILERDNLQMKESEIWDYLVKWGTARNPILPEKLEEWSDKNFMTLKTTVQQCLPLIRYFHIPDSDVKDKVKPYNKILDKQLWNDLENHFKLPDQPVKSIILPPRLVLTQELPARINGPFSTIINDQHTAIFSIWIDNPPTRYSPKDNPYEFQLILRGSKNGFSPKTFWDICDGHDNTIVIAKVEGTNEIIGGFNPLAWDKKKEGYMQTNKSFIFSFEDGNIHNSIISRVKDEHEALWYPHENNTYGPVFGYSEFMLKSEKSDFTQDKENRCYYYRSGKNKYERSIIKTDAKFSIIDYEVFKVIKKTI
ncbi:hypothetical protein Glove_750g50 [Diversispora epigaea]|uniref:BTB domain-containing protein n=1 Tax=Diversispora epigaea TaxID=1348612 RepID=A0A397G2D0_9GLOM|nr:hypothetical protein Glove_750g50 [Diversispora epigaea]